MATPPLLRLADVTKSFHDRTVIDDVSLTVQSGEVVSILGPSGSGKSTLLRLIDGLDDTDSGLVLLNGRSHRYDLLDGRLVELKPAERLRRRRDIGMVFQDFNLFPHMTLRDNLTLAPITSGQLAEAEARARANALLARIGLAEHADKYPSQLSGGQQQRAAIARALMVEPEILLFDEPTSALDPELVGEVLKVMRDLAEQGRTMLIVTHEIRFAEEVSDRIIVMDEGRIIADGTPKAVLRESEHPRVRSFLQRVA